MRYKRMCLSFCFLFEQNILSGCRLMLEIKLLNSIIVNFDLRGLFLHFISFLVFLFDQEHSYHSHVTHLSNIVTYHPPWK